MNSPITEPLLVSACLLGFSCRYDGGSNPCPPLVQLHHQGLAVPICPESLSGLPVPRPPCERRRDRIISRAGEDVTVPFQRGASLAFAKALTSGCRSAVLKGRSPSCGVGHIYDGTFSRRLVDGNGLFAQMLLDAGWEVRSEDEFLSDLHLEW